MWQIWTQWLDSFAILDRVFVLASKWPRLPSLVKKPSGSFSSSWARFSPCSVRGFLLKINPLLRPRWLFPACIRALFKVNRNISNRFHPRLWNNATNALFMDIPAWHHGLLFDRPWVFDYSITWLWQGSHLFPRILLLLIQPDMGGTSGKQLGEIFCVCAGAWVINKSWNQIL